MNQNRIVKIYPVLLFLSTAACQLPEFLMPSETIIKCLNFTNYLDFLRGYLEAFIRVDALQLAGARQTVHHGSAVGCLASSPKARLNEMKFLLFCPSRDLSFTCFLHNA